MDEISPSRASGVSALVQLRQMVTSPAEAIRLACVWEATAAKVGNVHPEASFADCSYSDFCEAARRIAPLLAGPVPDQPAEPAATGMAGAPPRLGERVLAAIAATRAVTKANVNLGIVLLIAPLALSRDRGDVRRVLAGLTPEDGAKVYRAIAMAGAGGLDSDPVDPQWDVATAEPAPIDLIAAMRMARDRDRIARQYAGDFDDFFDNVVPLVAAELVATNDIGEAIVRAQLRLLAAEPDSLILRKCGTEVASEVCRLASACVSSDSDWDRSQREALDRWLRQDGNRRNPGTTADLIAAALYWLIR